MPHPGTKVRRTAKQKPQVEAMTFSFLDLPGEIRNEVYKWLLPSPEHPKLVRLDWFCECGADAIRGQEPLPLAIYRTCKSIKHECPSLDYLLTTGAIVPTFQVWVWEKKDICHGDWPPEELFTKLLSVASRLRLRSEDILEGPDPLYLRSWKQGGRGTKPLHLFLGQSLANYHRTSSCDPDSSANEAAEPTEVGTVPTARSDKKRKILEIATPLYGLKLGSNRRKCLEMLLSVVLEQDLLDDLDAVEVRVLGVSFKPTALKWMNEQVARWLVKYKEWRRRKYNYLEYENDDFAAKKTPEQRAKIKAEELVDGDGMSEPDDECDLPSEELDQLKELEEEYADADDGEEEDQDEDEEAFSKDDGSVGEDNTSDGQRSKDQDSKESTCEEGTDEELLGGKAAEQAIDKRVACEQGISTEAISEGASDREDPKPTSGDAKHYRQDNVSLDTRPNV